MVGDRAEVGWRDWERGPCGIGVGAPDEEGSFDFGELI